MCPFGWNRERGVNSRRQGVDELGPARIPHPKVSTAQGAEVTPPRALMRGSLAWVLDHCLVDPQVLAPLDRKRLMCAADVDSEAAASRGLSADRAVAEIEGVGMRRLQSESNCTAVARTIELHSDAPDCSRNSGHCRLTAGRSVARPADRPRAEPPSASARRYHRSWGRCMAVSAAAPC